MNKAMKNKLLRHLSNKISELETKTLSEVKKKKIRAYVSSNVEKKWWGREALTLTLWR